METHFLAVIHGWCSSSFTRRLDAHHHRSNIASMMAQRQLSAASNSYAQSLQRLASEQRINTASDDAAGLAISSSLNTDGRVFTQAISNLNDGLSLLAIIVDIKKSLGHSNISTTRSYLRARGDSLERSPTLKVKY